MLLLEGRGDIIKPSGDSDERGEGMRGENDRLGRLCEDKEVRPISLAVNAES